MLTCIIYPSIHFLLLSFQRRLQASLTDIVSPVCSGISQRSPLSERCLEQRHPNQMSKAPHQAPLDVEQEWLYSDLLLDD